MRSGVGSARFAILLLIVATFVAACGTSVDPVDGASDELALSGSLAVAASGTMEVPDEDLDGATLEGEATIVLVTRSTYEQVAFHLDGAAEPMHTEFNAPYTLTLRAGDLTPGEHRLEARVPTGGTTTRVIARATFAVADASDAPTASDPAGPSEPDAPTAPADDGGTSPAEPTTPDGDGSTGDVAYDGPIVITQGGTYSGNWASDDSRVPAVDIRTGEPVVIENANIRSAGVLIRASWVDADLTIRNVLGEATYPSIAGRSAGRFLHVEGWRRVVVERSYLDGTSGLYLNASAEGATLRIVGNRVRNIDGRKADGYGGYDGASYVQFLQVNDGRSLRGAEIAWNEVVNLPFESRVEDVISLHATSGRPGDPVRVHDNYIEGAYPADPVNDTFSGGGIMLGDLTGAYLHAYRNQVVATGNYGIAISGGYDNRIYDNRVVACGQLDDGRPIASGNVGIYIWNIHGAADFAGNGGSGNEVLYVRHGSRNDWWVPDTADWTSNTRLTDGDACAAQDDEYAAWLGKVDVAQASLADTAPR